MRHGDGLGIERTRQPSEKRVAHRSGRLMQVHPSLLRHSSDIDRLDGYRQPPGMRRLRDESGIGGRFSAPQPVVEMGDMQADTQIGLGQDMQQAERVGST